MSKKVKLFALWGKYADSMEITQYSFATQAEADAFVFGAVQCLGWHDCDFFPTRARANAALEQAKEDQLGECDD